MVMTQLLQTIQQMTERHERLLLLADVKREVIIRDQVDDLMRITAEENAIVKEITRLELASRQYVVQAGEALGLTVSASDTISDLLQALPDVYAQQRRTLTQARAKLVETIDELKRKNELNRQLIDQSLQYISFNIDVLTDAPEQDMTYQ